MRHEVRILMVTIMNSVAPIATMANCLHVGRRLRNLLSVGSVVLHQQSSQRQNAKIAAAAT